MNIDKKMQTMFDSLVKEIESVYGDGMQTNISLTEIAQHVFPQLGQNVFKNNEYDFNKMRGKYAIVNTDNNQGIHWLATYQKGKNIYIFDSFGRHSSKLIPQFYKRIVNAGFNVIDTDHDAEQLDHQKDCGIRALSWIIIAYHQGIRKALKI